MDNDVINKTNSIDIGLDVNAVFAGGLAGIGSLGAMALVTSVIAGGSNLGAYIAVAHVAGYLGVSGSALTSLVAALGGPITIGLAIAGCLGFLVYKWWSNKTWQETMAEKVHKAINKKNPFTDITKTVNEFWDNTEKSIKAGFNHVQTETESHIQKLIEEADIKYDIKKLDEGIELIESLEKF